jgi:sarcosine oxidase subunit gamma
MLSAAPLPGTHLLGDASDAADPDDLALCDIGGFDRLLLKGPGLYLSPPTPLPSGERGAGGFLQRLADVGVTMPDRIFAASDLPAQGVVIRTGASEIFLEDGPTGTQCASLAEALGYGGDGVYKAPAPTASLLLSGERATEVLLETCNIDFREPSGDVVMTRVAGVSCSILFRTLRGHPVFQLWFDGTYGNYLGNTLLDIVREHKGGAVGMSAYFETQEV